MLKTDLEWVCSFDLKVSFYFSALGRVGKKEEREEEVREKTQALFCN